MALRLTHADGDVHHGGRGEADVPLDHELDAVSVDLHRGLVTRANRTADISRRVASQH